MYFAGCQLDIFILRMYLAGKSLLRLIQDLSIVAGILAKNGIKMMTFNEHQCSAIINSNWSYTNRYAVCSASYINTLLYGSIS